MQFLADRKLRWTGRCWMAADGRTSCPAAGDPKGDNDLIADENAAAGEEHDSAFSPLAASLA